MLIAGLATNVDELHQRVKVMEDEIRLLKEQLLLATRKQFGASSEILSLDQLHLFSTPGSEIVLLEDSKAANDEPADPPRKRNVRQAVRVSQDTPVDRSELDLTEPEKVCSCCDGALHRIGEDSTRQVEYIPPQTCILETVRPKYACRHCETATQSYSANAGSRRYYLTSKHPE